VESRRIIPFVYVLLLTVLGLAGGAFYFDAREELNQLKQTETQLKRRLAEAERRLAEQERIYERLRTDPEFVESIIRQRLHYARPGETIFRFPEPEPTK
jgi:cell division protein DivIC